MSLRGAHLATWQSRYQADKALNPKSQVPNKLQILNNKFKTNTCIVYGTPLFYLTSPTLLG
jgi:hypothetical protein